MTEMTKIPTVKVTVTLDLMPLGKGDFNPDLIKACVVKIQPILKPIEKLVEVYGNKLWGVLDSKIPEKDVRQIRQFMALAKLLDAAFGPASLTDRPETYQMAEWLKHAIACIFLAEDLGILK